jgi:D-alanyl-D-alanine dipeptidase
MKRPIMAALCAGLFFAPAMAETALPPGFVQLRSLAPDIQQDMRYAGPHNFTGKPVPGYHVAECLLLREVAQALKRAQAAAALQGFSLKVYDCYRPVRAVQAFAEWAAAPEDGLTRHFYPKLRKADLTRGYIARQSAHSTGTAVDLTLVPAGSAIPRADAGGSCAGPASEREADNSVDMGTTFDCFDSKSATEAPGLTAEQRQRRQQLKHIMEQAGFRNYPVEWWHYTYQRRAGARSFDTPIGQ